MFNSVDVTLEVSVFVTSFLLCDSDAKSFTTWVLVSIFSDLHPSIVALGDS